jgi:hypothetical protein
MADADPFAKYVTAPTPAPDPFAKYAAKPGSGSFLDRASAVVEAVSAYAADNPVSNYIGQEIQSGIIDPALKLGHDVAEGYRHPPAPTLNPLPKLQQDATVAADTFNVAMSIPSAVAHATLMRPYGALVSALTGGKYQASQGEHDMGIALLGLGPEARGGVPIRAPAPHMVDAFTTAKAPKAVEAPGPAKPAPATDVAAPAEPAPAARPQAMPAAVEGTPEPTIAAPSGEEPPAPTGGPLSFVRPVEPKSFWADRKAEIDSKGWAGAIADWAEHGYTSLVAEQHPLVRATEQLRSGIEAATGKPVDLLPSEDPTKLARAGHDVFNIGHMDVMHGVHDYHGVEPTSPALADVVASVTQKGQRGDLDPPGALKQFNDYLTARRGVEEWDRYDRGEIPNEPLPVAAGGDRANLEMHIAQAEAANPRYVEMADAVNQYGRALWKKQLDAGLISRETYDGANNAREFYVPFKRAMDEGATIKGGGSSGEGSVAKGFEGSNRDVLGPMEALVNQTYEVARRIRQNDINLSLVNLGRQFDEVMAAKGVEAPNGLLERVKEPNRPMGISPDELKAMTNRNAPDDMIDTMFDEDAMHVWRPGRDQRQGPGGHLHLGGRQARGLGDQGPEWGADIFNAMTGVSKPVDDLIMRIGAAASATLRAGVTTNPEFMFTNFIRDQMSAWIVTDEGFIPGEGALGVADEVKGADVTRKYGLAGGISGGQAVAGVRERGDPGRHHGPAPQGLRRQVRPDAAGRTTERDPQARREITETGTRLQLFKRAYARAISRGDERARRHPRSRLHRARLHRLRPQRLAHGRHPQGGHLPERRIQGLDKTLRTVTANGAVGGRVALKDVLKPLFEDVPEPGCAPRCQGPAAGLQGVGEARASSRAFGLTLEALYHDDRSTRTSASTAARAPGSSSWATTGWRAEAVREGLPSNVAERAFEATTARTRARGAGWPRRRCRTSPCRPTTRC